MTIQKMAFYLIIFVMFILAIMFVAPLVFKLWINIKQTKKEISDVKMEKKENKK